MSNKEVEKVKGKKPSREKIFSVITSVLLVLAILFCGFVMLQLKSNGYVSIFGYSVFHVASGSMEPAIPVGTLIICQRTDIDDIKQRDIITFLSLESYMLNKPVTHRVVGIENVNGETALRTRGDANNSEDGYYVTDENLVGRVVYQTSGENIFKKLYDLLTTKMGFLSIVIMPVMFLVAIILRENAKKINREIANIKRELAARAEQEGEEGDEPTAEPDEKIDQENSVLPQKQNEDQEEQE